MDNIMVDLETLATHHNAVIIQIGACYFDWRDDFIGHTFIVNINIKDSLKRGLEVDGDTIKWWFEQNNKTWLQDTVLLTKGLRLFREFCHENKKAKIWSHSTFDIPILANAYRILGESMPFPYTNIRDIRTLVDLSGIKKKKTVGDPKTHNALEDCIYQVGYCLEAYKKIKENSDESNNDV